MVNKRTIVKGILLSIGIILIILFLYFIRESNNKQYAEEEVKTVSNINEYTDISIFTRNTKRGNDILFEMPKEETVQDYNTYYGNRILITITGERRENIVSYINESFNNINILKYRDGDIFEGIEKVYYLQKLADENNENINNQRISELILDLVMTSYDEEGFFNYHEFDEYLVDMKDDEIRTTRAYHTMMTLYLCKEYGLLEKLDVNAIETYLLDTIEKNKDVVTLYYVYLCFDYLNINKEFYKDLDINLESDNLDSIEINAYVSLIKQMDLVIEKERKDIIVSKMKSYLFECRLSNMMELFIAVDTLDKLGELINDTERDELLTLLSIYQNRDGTFPCISYYMLDNKQLLMHYLMSKRMKISVDIEDYERLLSHEYDEQDYYDLYSYAYFASRLGIDTKRLKEKLIIDLGKCKLDNESSVGYILLALIELGVDLDSNIKDKYLNEDIINYAQLIIYTESFEYNVQDLIMLYGLLKSNIIDIEGINIESIENIEVENYESMQALVLYYKYKIIEIYIMHTNDTENRQFINELEMVNILPKLRTKGGYKMNVNDEFIDLQATYYVLDLISNGEN